MPIYRATLVYYDTATGMGWSLTNTREDATPIAVNTAAQLFNTAYLGVCAEGIVPIGLRVSDIDVYRDMYFTPVDLFTTRLGAIAGDSTEISSCAVVRCYGAPGNGGSSMWRMHGVSDTLVTGSQIDPSAGIWTDINIAAAAWFRQWRPGPVVKLPIVNPPIGFATNVISPTLYTRRLGRPITLAGQQRAYLRTVP